MRKSCRNSPPPPFVSPRGRKEGVSDEMGRRNKQEDILHNYLLWGGRGNNGRRCQQKDLPDRYGHRALRRLATLEALPPLSHPIRPSVRPRAQKNLFALKRPRGALGLREGGRKRPPLLCGRGKKVRESKVRNWRGRDTSTQGQQQHEDSHPRSGE